jgi:hypothetical protein
LDEGYLTSLTACYHCQNDAKIFGAVLLFHPIENKLSKIPLPVALAVDGTKYLPNIEECKKREVVAAGFTFAFSFYKGKIAFL